MLENTGKIYLPVIVTILITFYMEVCLVASDSLYISKKV